MTNLDWYNVPSQWSHTKNYFCQLHWVRVSWVSWGELGELGEVGWFGWVYWVGQVGEKWASLSRWVSWGELGWVGWVGVSWVSHCLYVSQVMSPHHSDQMSQRSQSFGSLCMSTSSQKLKRCASRRVHSVWKNLGQVRFGSKILTYLHSCILSF